MELLTDAFREQIRPFFFSKYESGCSACLNAGTYRNDVFEEYYEKTGAEGGGYGWDAVADLYIREQLPQYADALSHDSEADMFCVYSKSEEAVHAFLQGFKAWCDDDAKFRDLMDRADFAAWD